jgi:hypothetical protein
MSVIGEKQWCHKKAMLVTHCVVVFTTAVKWIKIEFLSRMCVVSTQRLAKTMYTLVEAAHADILCIQE